MTGRAYNGFMEHPTPGPWTVGVVDGETGGNKVWHDGSPVAQNVWNPADRHLIAAAPDLLAALRDILHAPLFHPEEEWDGLFANGRAAIAKATGSEPS